MERSGLRARADHVLLRWAQQSAPGEAEVVASTPLVIEPRLPDELRRLALVLDRLLRRFADAVLARMGAPAEFSTPDFPLAKEIRAAGSLHRPFFWSRFDVFERAGGGLAVLEYNCDKPAGQREVWAAEEMGPRRANPNRGAQACFRLALAREWEAHARRMPAGSTASRHPRLAVLVDPDHREEFRLAYLFGRVATALGWPWEVVGPSNLVVDGGRVLAYGEPVDIVLRQYPAEFLHELPAAEALWSASLEGRLLWLNDPRAAMTQAKSLFAHLWELVRQRRWLTRAEVATIERYVPPTGLASTSGWLDRAAARPGDWVIKPVFGRYSEEVTLGALATPEQWQAALARAAERPDGYIVQAYVPPRRRWLPDERDGRGGYVNWGVYMAGGAFAGLCPRLQPTPLTEEGRTWWAPLERAPVRPEQPTMLMPRAGIAFGRSRRHRGGLERGARPRRPGARKSQTRDGRGPGPAWQAIADRHALAGYTSAWAGGLGNFTLAAVSLSPAMWDELCQATLILGSAVGRVLTHLESRPELVAPLGIPERVASLSTRPRGAGPWSFLSRFDWARTTDGRWKLMEINSDTPAGLWEAGPVAADVARLHPAARAPATDLWRAVEQSWRRGVRRAGLAEAEAPSTVGMLGVVESAEDQDQLRAHLHSARNVLPRGRFEFGAPDDVVIRDGRAWLHDRPLDLVFRYYPMDWLADERFDALIELVAADRIQMLPPAHALIPQSKAFLALLWELVERGFFPLAEATAIRDHVPLTTLDAQRFRRTRHVIKPYLEREGQGVRFSSRPSRRDRGRRSVAEVVHQEALDLATGRVPVLTGHGWSLDTRSLVFGVYVAGEEIAGIYTRAGARVTGREAVFVPTLLRS